MPHDCTSWLLNLFTCRPCRQQRNDPPGERERCLQQLLCLTCCTLLFGGVTGMLSASTEHLAFEVARDTLMGGAAGSICGVTSVEMAEIDESRYQPYFWSRSVSLPRLHQPGAYPPS